MRQINKIMDNHSFAYNSIKKAGVTLLAFVCLLCITNFCRAQQNYFLYLQTENQQPFYAKLDKKVYASAGAGYVIIPKLVNGNYNITIGFPQTSWPEQNFNCNIDKQDLGFIVKKKNDNSWSLFNLQTMQLIASANDQKPAESENNNSIAGNNPVSEEKKELVNNGIPATTENSIADQPPTTTETGLSDQPISANTLKKIAQKQDDDEVQMTFIDITNDKADTIQVTIPIEKLQHETMQENPTLPTANDSNVVNTQQEQSEDAAAKTTGVQNESEANITEEKQAPETNITTPVTTTTNSTKTTNIYCDKIADDDDFFKLRKKMAAQSNSERMIAAAKKFFKNECFTTEQIKNLSVLFLNDEGKYKLFDAAYPYISDLQNFATLEQQFSDNYYRNRFKAMIRN